MPIFEYQCNKCGNVMEFLEKASSRSKHVCDKCGDSNMSKLFSSFAVGRSDCSESKQCGMSRFSDLYVRFDASGTARGGVSDPARVKHTAVQVSGRSL